MDEHAEYIAKIRKIRMDHAMSPAFRVVLAFADEEINRCPIWVSPEPYARRQRCVKFNMHPGEHTSVYVINELGLD